MCVHICAGMHVRVHACAYCMLVCVHDCVRAEIGNGIVDGLEATIEQAFRVAAESFQRTGRSVS